MKGKINFECGNITYWEKRCLKGNITNDEWSKMSIAMRIHLKRYLKKHRNGFK